MLPAIIAPVADADADIEHRQPERTPAAVQHLELDDHVERCVHSVLSMKFIVQGRTEKCHHLIPDELVQRAAVLQDDFNHPAEVLIEERNERFRFDALGHT